MARPSRTGGKTSKAKARNTNPAKGRKTAKPKRRIAPVATRAKRGPASRPSKDLKEAREQQAATAEILKVIASSPSDVQPVFAAIASSANRLIGGFSTAVFRFVDGVVHLAAITSVNPAGDKAVRASYPRPIGDYFAVPQAGEVLAVTDTESYPDARLKTVGRIRGFRSIVYVPLKSAGTSIGAIGVGRKEPGPFAPRHVALLQTFADQAVIAIENARLFNETQEALERQTATADILKVISSSPDDVQPVFEAIAERAKRLVGAHATTVLRVVGDRFELGAFTPVSEEADATLRASFPLSIANNPQFEMAYRGEITEVADTESEMYAYAKIRDIARARGFRSRVLVPLRSDNGTVGAISVTRTEPGSFAAHHVQLLQTFADQAVIAIQNVRLFNETREALQRQTATAEILKVIASSPSDVQPVFDAIVLAAVRLLGCDTAHFLRCDSATFQPVAVAGPDGLLQAIYPEPVPIDPDANFPSRAIAARKDLYLPDWSVIDVPAYERRTRKIRGVKSSLFLPLLSKGECVGLIALGSKRTNKFSEDDIALAGSFRDQALIAIENVRLFNEVQAKTRDLSEALTYQTGSSNILSVIASSPTDVAPVLKAIVDSAAELCDAYDTAVMLSEGDFLRFSEHHGSIPIGLEKWPINRRWTAGRAFVERKAVHLRDLLSDEGDDFPDSQELARLQGHRSILSVPLLRENESIGVISLRRTEVQPFTDKQIALLQTFADQAVIAIGNVRLFEQVQQRTRDLTESLQQQTATADVLKVISRSSVDLKTVLDTLVDTVAHLCRADQATMFRRRGDKYHLVATHGLSAEAKEFVLTHPLTNDGGTISSRVAAERRSVHIPDVLQDPEYSYREGQKVVGYRTLLGIPLLREESLIGIFTINRTRVEPFTDKEIELASTFADQAVIAIENARLFEELRDRQAELRVTFDNMGDGVVMFDAAACLAAWNRNLQELLDLPDAFLAERPSLAEFFRYLADRGEYISAELEAELSRAVEDPRRELRFERTRPDGRIVEVRRNPVPDGGFVLIYSDITKRKRAEESIRAARDAAEKALHELQLAQDRLVQTQKLASLGQLTAGIAHEIKNPLNFVNNFSALSAELTDELNDVLKPVTLDSKVRAEVDELTGLLKDNLEKVVQHGKRADSIVKNMLLHSREGSREYRPADINSLLDESLNLAYHGARAEKGEFNITLRRDFDEDAGTIELFPQEITRAFLNLIANGVYAATKRKTEDEEPGFEPTLLATTKNLGTTVEIRIRDNGTGIPAEVREKMFNPFFTTKPAGEGTGLGLSMTHDIIVKQHGGRIDVTTEPGQFTEFTIVLPRNLSGRDRGET